MGSLAYILVEERPLALEVQSLANRLVRLDILEPSRILACVVAQSLLLGQIKARQFDDPHLEVLRETVLQSSAKEVSISEDGVMRLQGRLCVPNVNGLREMRHTVHDILFIQLKYKHQRPGVLLQQMPIPEWKWEHITMDFVVGLSWTLRKFDVVLVIVDILTKSAHLIPAVITYTSERLAQIYIPEIVRLHGVPVSIILDRGPQFTSHFWRAFLPLAEFAYNNSYQSSIEIAPFEAIYGRRCRSPIRWFDPGRAKLYDTDLVKDALEKVKLIQQRFRTA
ncbi:uncharacterized protein [Nicotiana sylvestris]|uniref:uncharacterized protein n=1 Tax=Nicotiana sylvestris TaxID=4096 RepID=UPI00388C43DE